MVLLVAASYPVETHVKSFGALLAHVAGEDAVGGRASGFDWGGRLQVAHFDEGRADGNILLAVGENCSIFGFGGGSRDSADGLAVGDYWSMRGQSGTDVGWWWIVV